MRHSVPGRVQSGTAGVAALLASVGLAYVAQRPAVEPGLIDALAPVVAIAAYVGGMTAASAGLFGLRCRAVLWTAVAWVAVLLVLRVAVEPGVALASVGSLHEALLERWTALSNAALWFVAVPLEVVFGAASCGAVLVVLALTARVQDEPARRVHSAQWRTQP